MSRDADSVTDILNASRIIVGFMDGMTREQFDGDARTRDAVAMRLMVIGEATKRLSTAFRESSPEVPWRRMAGVRDVLIHGYDQIDPQAVWDAATGDIPELVRILQELLPPPPGDA